MNQVQVPRPGGAGGRRPSPVLPRGHRLGAFTIDGVFGRGAFGVTYLAHDADGAVALKALDPQAPKDAAAAFRREAEILGVLRQDNIVALKHFEPSGDPPFMVLAQPGGRSLADVLDGGAEPPELKPLLFGLLDALDHLHGAGFLHRDVKPGNVVLARADHPVLVDFGAARPIGAASAAGSQATPGYGALEQFVADGSEGPWTDLYGVAALAYRMVTGAPPPAALDRADGTEMVPAAEAAAGRQPPAVLAAIDWALEQPVHRRPQSVADWRTALSEAWSAAPERSAPTAGAAPRSRSAAPVDDYPPTEEITRITPPRRRPRHRIDLDLPAAPEPAARPPSEPRRGGAAGWIRALVAVVVLAAFGIGGYILGWPYYLRNIKSEWLVDAAGGGDVRTIAEALEMAREGALIEVRPGTYPESLSIVRPVTLTGLPDGAGGAPGVIVAPLSGACLSASAAPATVSGIAFRRDAADPAPCIDLLAGLAFRDNRVESAGGPAVHIGGGADPTVTGNALSAIAAPALLIDDGGIGQIRGNSVTSAEGPGIVVSGAAPAIEGNTVEGAGMAGMLFDAAAAGRVADNTIRQSAASGIEIRGAADPEIVGNRIEASRQAGIFVFDGGLGQIAGNTVTGNAFSGVVIGPGGQPTLTGNTVRENVEHGVLALSGAGGVLRDNAIEGNGGYGIAMEQEVSTTLDANRLSGNREPQIRRDGVVRPFPVEPDSDPEAAAEAEAE